MTLLIRNSAIPAEKASAYRYELRREWDDKLPPLVACMLNPSMADHEDNDPTISRQIKRALDHQFGSLIVVNAFAWRTPEPSAMIAKHLEGQDVVGPDNDRHLESVFREAKRRAGLVFVGWGGNIAFMPQRASQIAALAARTDVDLHCLRRLKSGHPGHPLYVAYGKPFTPWTGVTAG